MYLRLPLFSVMVMQLHSPDPSTILSCGLDWLFVPGYCLRSPFIRDAVLMRVSDASIFGIQLISCSMLMVSSAMPDASTGCKHNVNNVRCEIAAEPVADRTGCPCSFSRGPSAVRDLDPVNDDDAPLSSIDRCVRGVLVPSVVIMKHVSGLCNIVGSGVIARSRRIMFGGVVQLVGVVPIVIATSCV